MKFVVRDTSHPQEDLARNWSAPCSGYFCADMTGMDFASADEAIAHWNKLHEGEVKPPRIRYHPAHETFVEVHYEGLGAWELEADNLPDALVEAAGFREGLASTDEAGDGHFYAEDVVGFHQVSEGRYIFEIAE